MNTASQPRDDQDEDSDYDESAVSSQDLGESYQALLGQQSWEVDVPGIPAIASNPSPPPEPAMGGATPALAVPPPLERIIESLLFVGGQPLTATRAGEILRGLTPIQFRQTIDLLNRNYRRQNRPYLIQPFTATSVPRGRGEGSGVRGEQGYVLALRPVHRPVLDRLFGALREARLSPQAVDVLSLVAYRQPVSKHEIEGIRGVESGQLLRQLLRRGLIAIIRRVESNQREVCYATTQRFLELFRLQSLDELPQTQDLQRL